MAYLFKFIRKAVRKYPKKYSSDFIFKGIESQCVHVLGNGPSLDDSLYLIGDHDDVVMVNFSPLTDLFKKLKPKYLCFADSAFFKETGVDYIEQKKDRLFKVLSEVDWKMSIVIPFCEDANLIPTHNENISFKSVNTIPLDFSVKFPRFWLYKKNLSMPWLPNVVIMAVYVVLQRGYRTVYLHGVDADSYKNICINMNNEMVAREYHYYGTKDRNLNQEKSFGFTTGSLYKRLDSEVITFRSYVDLSSYAQYLGIKVLNASPNSMIDAFERYDHKTNLSKINHSA